ncbi:hypothetical protein [uncultured Hoeflea sp.]|uniref:hypothetical protein n=1 Tax=uncultured Hoeflea sp. TaxID=538666 RepID=UPI0026151CCF|nr:hypothetical protein [uncultured Hoeflea sp.]
MEISLIPPGFDPADASTGTKFPVSLGADRHFQQLDGYARIYCENINGRYPYALCLAPTYFSCLAVPAAPAGAWTIRLRNRSPNRIQCQLEAQTDQQVSLGSRNHRRWYFVDQH